MARGNMVGQQKCGTETSAENKKGLENDLKLNGADRQKLRSLVDDLYTI